MLRCSYCHTVFAEDAGAEQGQEGEAELACPGCKAEAGLEVVKTETAPPMQMFGILLGVAALASIGGTLFGIL